MVLLPLKDNSNFKLEMLKYNKPQDPRAPERLMLSHKSGKNLMIIQASAKGKDKTQDYVSFYKTGTLVQRDSGIFSESGKVFYNVFFDNDGDNLLTLADSMINKDNNFFHYGVKVEDRGLAVTQKFEDGTTNINKYTYEDLKSALKATEFCK